MQRSDVVDNAPRDIPSAPLPKAVAIGADSNGLVMFRVSTCHGFTLDYYSPEEAIQIGDRLAAIGRRLATTSRRDEVPRLVVASAVAANGRHRAL